MAKKYLDYDGLLYFWQKVKTTFAKATDVPTASTTTPKMDGIAAVGSETKWAKGDHVHPHDSSKVDKVTGKGLSTNDFTDALKTKLEGIAEGAEVNVQSDWNATSGDAFIKNKPTIPSAVQPTTTTPKMDGTASVGSETKYAKGDHVHPSDTSRVPTTRTVNGKALNEDITLKAEDIYINANENVETAINERIKATDRTLGPDEGDFKYDFDVTIGETIHSDHFYNTNWIDHNFAMASTVLEGKVDKVEGKGLSTNDYTDDEKTKLASLPLAQDAVGVQGAGTSTYGETIGFSYGLGQGQETKYFYTSDAMNTAFNGAMTLLNGKVDTTSIGQANGVAPLDANSKIDAQYLPSYVDDVVEAYPISGATELSAGWLSETSGGSALTPASGVIYVLMADTTNYSVNTQFRWATNTYVKLNDGGVTAITNGEIDTIVAS